MFNDTSMTLIVPLAAIGRDDTFDFALYVGPIYYGPSDCAPNGGHISFADGDGTWIQALLGDANCDGSVNAVDAMLILQVMAGLIGGLPCQQLGDANHSGGLGPLDAALILQYDSGLLEALPAPPPR